MASKPPSSDARSQQAQVCVQFDDHYWELQRHMCHHQWLYVSATSHQRCTGAADQHRDLSTPSKVFGDANVDDDDDDARSTASGNIIHLTPVCPSFNMHFHSAMPAVKIHQ